MHRFREAGLEAVVAAPSKRRLHLVMHDFEPGWDTYVERPGYGVQADLSYDEVESAAYDGLMAIGGRAPEYLRHIPRVLEIVKEMDAAGKWIFAICHGIQVLIAAGIVSGRKVTCYEHVRNEVALCGGTWENRQAVRDGRLVTAQTWESHVDFYREIFNCFREAAP